MSFSSEVKHEITLRELEPSQMRAQLSSFFHLNATVHIVNNNFELQIEIANATIAKRMFQLLKERYEVETNIQVLKRQNLRKNNYYRIRVKEKALLILEDLAIYDSGNFREIPHSHIVINEEDAQAYIAGAFLASGSVNSPNTPNYHLEIGVNTEAMGEFIIGILNRFGLNPKMTLRRSKHIVYLKAADEIADFLKIVGSYNKTMEFEDVRIQRDFRNSLTRLTNMELANDLKIAQAGNKHIEAIYKLIEHNRFQHIEERLIQVAELRMDFPESSLNELTYEYYNKYGEKISRSGLQHRFNKIIEMADKLGDN